MLGEGDLLQGSGPPNNDNGDNGDIYVDLSTGDIYQKTGDVWNIVQGAAGGSGEIGSGSPEGVVTATPGTTYFDTAANAFWVKETGVGNTGWTPLIL